jgi:esterase
MTGLNYIRRGNENDQTIVLIHGLFGSLDNLNGIARLLAKTNDVVSIDCRNHGNSFKSDAMSYHDMASDVLMLLNTLGIDSPVIVGHSMGGKIAMSLALSNTIKLNAMVVIDIAPKSYPPFHNGIIHELLSIDVRDYNRRSEVDDALKAKIPSQQLRQFLLKSLVATPNGLEWKLNIQAIHNNYESISGFPKFNGHCESPCLFIRAEQSNYIESNDWGSITALFPNAHRQTIEGSHWVHAERPNEIADFVQTFID